jgi:hypothetical protein
MSLHYGQLMPAKCEVWGKQVRCYISDDEQRWMMWYTGRNRESPKLDAVFPSSGSIGMHPGRVLARCCLVPPSAYVFEML